MLMAAYRVFVYARALTLITYALIVFFASAAVVTSISITPASANSGFQVGDTGPGGGKIFYVNNTGFACGPDRSVTCTYLEAAPNGWNTGSDPSRTWSQSPYQSAELIAAKNDGIGWGYSNTRAIMTQGSTNTATSAAALADAFTVTVSGVVYDDWYLPSIDELNQMWSQRNILGMNNSGAIAGGDPYWSSSEHNESNADYRMFSGSLLNENNLQQNKSSSYYVRPVRAGQPAPNVTTFSSATSTPRNDSIASYSLVFSQSVTGLTTDDIENAGTATGCSYSLTGSGTTYTLSISACSDGTIQPRIKVNSVLGSAMYGPSSAATATSIITKDSLAPTASVTAATILATQNASVQSSEAGTAYLVNETVTVTSLASITTGAADNLQNSVSIATANTSTNLAATGLVPGTYKLYTIDGAGNLSAASTYTISIKPATPGTPDLDAASDLGTSSTDNSTSDETPTFSLSSLLSGASVTLTATPASGNPVTCSFTSTGSSGSCTFTSLSNGTYSITAVQSFGGVNSDTSTALANVVINKIAISTPATPDLHADSDTGISNSDNLSKDNTPTISVSGTFTGTAIVTAAKTGSTSVTCDVSSNSCTLGTLSDGVWSITVKDQDSVGNSATSSALSITINATASAPSVGSLGICSWPGCADPIQVGNYMEAYTPHLSLGSPSAVLTYKWYQCPPSPETLLGGETNSRLYIDEQKVGKSFKVEITATNFEGSSSSSTDCYSISSYPGAPTSLVAASSNGSVTISFTAPSYVGNGITSYLYSTDGTNYVDLSSSSSPVTISGLTNGTTYSIRLKARNSTGNSLASSAVSVTPASAPGAPTVGVATATGPDSASIAFTAPTSNGGSAITSYTVTSSPGSITATGMSSPISISGLSAGTAYTFTVKANNSAGSSVASSASASISTNAATAPGAPTIGAATATSTTTANVAFTAPTSNGGSAITSYTVTSSPGSITATGTSSPIAITGLTAGTAYTFTVTATNNVGTSSASSSSTSISTDPIVASSAPTNVVGSATGQTTARVTFTAPTSTGGAAITSYVVTSSPSGATCTAGANSTTYECSGLTAGTAYTFSITATNAAGLTSSSSSPSSSITTESAPVQNNNNGGGGGGGAPAPEPDPEPSCNAACIAAQNAAAERAAAEKAAAEKVAAEKVAAEKAAAEKAAAEKAAAEKAVAEKVAAEKAAAVAVAEKTRVDLAAAAAIARAAVEIATAAASAKVEVENVAEAVSSVLSSANSSKADTAKITSDALASIESAPAVASKAARAKSADKAAETAASEVRAAAKAAEKAAKSTKTQELSNPEIVIGSQGAGSTSSQALSQANDVARAAKAAAKQVAATAATKASESKAAVETLQSDVDAAIAEVSAQQEIATTLALEAKNAAEIATAATAEKIAATSAAKSAAETLLALLTEKVTLAEQASNATTQEILLQVQQQIELVNLKIAEAEKTLQETSSKAELAIAAQSQAVTLAERTKASTEAQLAKVEELQTLLPSKTQAVVRAIKAAAVAEKVATAAKQAAAKIPSSAVIARKPGISTGKNSTRATISGLKPGQKVKVIVNVKPGGKP